MKLKHLTIFFSLLAILIYVVLLPVKNINATETEKADVQKLFDGIFLKMTYASYALNHDMDIAKEILKLENLIAQGANPNKKISFSEGGDYGYSYTPISYIFRTCGNDFRTYYPDDQNFYLDIVKLLLDNNVDWNAKNIEKIYEGYSDETSTIAERLKRTEENSTKPECLEALDYVKNHLKENNIILE